MSRSFASDAGEAFGKLLIQTLVIALVTLGLMLSYNLAAKDLGFPRLTFLGAMGAQFALGIVGYCVRGTKDED